jgi:hypothetical protein
MKKNVCIVAKVKKIQKSEPVFLNVYGTPESDSRNEFRQPVCSLAGRYDNPLPLRFLAPKDS